MNWLPREKDSILGKVANDKRYNNVVSRMKRDIISVRVKQEALLKRLGVVL